MSLRALNMTLCLLDISLRALNMTLCLLDISLRQLEKALYQSDRSLRQMAAGKESHRFPRNDSKEGEIAFLL